MAETIGVLILSAAGAGEITGIAGLGTLAGTTVAGVSLAAVVGTAAIIGVSIGLNYALRPGLPKPEDGSQALKQGIPPRIRGYGRNRLAGYYMLFEAGGSPPATSYDIQAFHSGRIGQIVSLYLHDDLVVINSDINAPGGSFGAVLGTYSDNRYGGGHIQIAARLGSNSQFYLGGEPDLAGFWDSSHHGNGIAWIALICGGLPNPANHTVVYPHGKPELSVVADCSPVWDPRAPSQSRTDESTWLVSSNPVIQLLDYLTRADGGMGLDFNILFPAARLAQWMAEADLCDQLVDKASGGQEARYQSAGWFRFDDKPEDIINKLLATCDGWMAGAGDGTFALTVGFYRAPTDPPLTEKHILGFALNYGEADEQSVNQLDISFTDPASKYVSVQTQPWRDEAAIARSGVTRSQPLELGWVQSNSQARRLADRAMQRLNSLLTGSFTTSLYGLRYRGQRWVPLQYPFISGLQNSVVEIQNAEIDLMAGRIHWNFILIAPDVIEAYNPNLDEGSVPIVPPAAIPPRLNFTISTNSQYLALLEDI